LEKAAKVVLHMSEVHLIQTNGIQGRVRAPVEMLFVSNDELSIKTGFGWLKRSLKGIHMAD
jgi:hypothetical protein